MDCDQIKKGITAFLNNELSQDEKKLVAEHLMQCDSCRRVHDEEKTGVLLAARLQQTDAPEVVWANIMDSIEERPGFRLGIIPQGSWLSMRKGIAFAAAIAIVSLVAALVYFNLFNGGPQQVAVVQDRGPYVEPVAAPQQPAESLVSDTVIEANARSQQNTNVEANQPDANLAVTRPGTLPSWKVETIAGDPKVEGSGTGDLGVGQVLETDGRSRARIAVADIGTVEISPNSRIRLAETGNDLHRLSLERGKLHAKIFAPPRLFVVDTPSAKAVDLGCEYTLDVDKKGDSLLHVTGGWVALELGGRESIVPAGMMCKTKKGIGLGTPFSPDATENFKKALDNFDFSGAGAASVRTIVREADYYDMFTLWHLLSRVRKDDRGLIYDTLAGLVKPPAGVTREGVLSLDRKMLDAWKAEVETAWFN